MKIVFTGGGSGGHIFPIIAIVRELKKIFPIQSLDIFFIGPHNKEFQKILEKEGITVKSVRSGKIRRYFNIKSFFQNIFDIFFNIPIGIIQSFFNLFIIAPDLIFSKGGEGSIGSVIIGKLLGVPIFFHESDVSPGASNKFSVRFVLEIFVSFRETEFFPKDKMILTGNPVRKEITEGTREDAEKIFSISSNKQIILIIGGSQGSQRINDEILEILPNLLEDFEVIHQCGVKNFEQVKSESYTILSESLRKMYHPYPSFNENELKNAYTVSNLIVSRSGSGSIFEIAACGKPSILIPLPEAAQNHQVKNAYNYAETGSCLVIEESNYTSHYFLKTIKDLFDNKEKMKKMSEAALSFAKPKAAKIIAEYINAYLIR